MMIKPHKDLQHPIHSLLAKRWSIRAFGDQPITDEDLNSILEAARWSPSAFNEQPWRFIYGLKGSAAFDKLAELLNPGNAWAKESGLLILTLAVSTLERNGKHNRHYMHDVGLAAASMVFEGMNKGIFAHQMGGFDADKARAYFAIPEHVEPVTMIAFGYQGDLDSLSDELKVKEQKPQQRKAIEEFAFEAGDTVSL